ncbi:serine dehydratase beta chain [Paraburkholderia sp. BL6669N2]|uniref:serine dehydratase beta chain n=1 Tax=Paraburkholderia sp. BL6669N2 TaxID=1938807 RepID=UPI000E277CED|nr:serine dehydratase beta chain [Paraburkholderia sp. BL6669N2]
MTNKAAPFIGVFDLFRVGVGPSSSHTVGPMIAASRFIAEMPTPAHCRSIQVELFGSLALTGMGHGTDSTIILGLLGEAPATVDPDLATTLVRRVREEKVLRFASCHEVSFDPSCDVLFLMDETLPRHPNAMRFTAAYEKAKFSRVYYSVGGGFVETNEEPTDGGLLDGSTPLASTTLATSSLPFAFETSSLTVS